MASSRGSKKLASKSAPNKPEGSVAPVPSIPAPPPKWVIVQLTTAGEREKDLNALKRSVHRILGRQIDVFIPAVSQRVRDESHTMFYMDGYVFILHEAGTPYLRLQETTYFNQVLTKPGSERGKRDFCLLDDRELNPMRRGMQSMKVGAYREGQSVKIIKGNFKNMLAEVSYVYDDGETVQISVDLRSAKRLLDFPTSYLQKVDQ